MKKSPKEVDVFVGRKVRARRMEIGISQEKLGDALGLTFQQVQKYEKGANRIGCSRLVDISNYLQVPPAYFFEGCPGTETFKRDKVTSVLSEFSTNRKAADLATAFVKLSPPLQARIVDLTIGMADAKADS